MARVQYGHVICFRATFTYAAGPALDIQHSPVRVYLAHAGQPGQAGSDHPAEKQPKSLLKTQENRKANLLPEIGNFREQGKL